VADRGDGVAKRPYISAAKAPGGYGLTETYGGSTVSLPDLIKIGTVGKALPGTEVKINPDGEIMIRGGGVMQGYYNNPAATAKVRTADVWLPVRPGTDIPVLNAMLRTIIHEGLADEAYIAARTVGWDDVRAAVEPYTPELAERIAGVPAARIVAAAAGSSDGQATLHVHRDLVGSSTYREHEPDLESESRHQCIYLVFSYDLSSLFRPVVIGPLRAGNSRCIQPMEGCDGTLDGRPDELTFRRYQRFGSGGAKLIWGEATAVIEEARANPRQLLLNEQTAPDLERLLRECRHAHRAAFGSDDDLIIGLQLTHSGRYSYRRPLLAFQ